MSTMKINKLKTECEKRDLARGGLTEEQMAATIWQLGNTFEQEMKDASGVSVRSTTKVGISIESSGRMRLLI